MMQHCEKIPVRAMAACAVVMRSAIAASDSINGALRKSASQGSQYHVVSSGYSAWACCQVGVQVIL